MKKKQSISINVEMELVLKRIDELNNWLSSHHPFHDEYEQMRRNLSIALYKVKQIESRGKRPSTQIATTYSLPTINY